MVILGIDPGLANTGWGIIEEREVRCGVVPMAASRPLPGRIWQPPPSHRR